MRKSPKHVIVVRDDEELHDAIRGRADRLGISGTRLAQHLMRVALGMQDGLPASLVRKAGA